jgi:hypothetical protein
LNRKNLLLHLRHRNGSSEHAAANASPNPWRYDGRVSDEPHRGQNCFPPPIALNLEKQSADAGVVVKKSNRLFKINKPTKTIVPPALIVAVVRSYLQLPAVEPRNITGL